MAQTKADRQAAAKKAAATRKRNAQKEKDKRQAAGKKAASTRQAGEATASARDAKVVGARSRARKRPAREVRTLTPRV